ncbi:MAG: MFS transporter [Paracoccaceae bacterium]|nr:MFS transporter [Paracoccaceae bacterium]
MRESRSKSASIAVLIVCEIAVLSLWFSAAAVLPDMAREAELEPGDLAWSSTAVQLGFGFGAIGYAVLSLADRHDPRHVFLISALIGAAANLAIIAAPIGGWQAIALRAATGAAMAGVYPVGMKIAAGWGRDDRALLMGLLIAALTIGSGSPHLISLMGGADWRLTIWASTGLAVIGGVGILWAGLGPFHARAPRLDFGAVALVWRDPRIRLAVAGYLGHMWELYAFWAWVGVFAGLSFGLAGAEGAQDFAKLTAFIAIILGGIASVPAGWLADRIGRAKVAMACLIGSGGAALASAAVFGGPVWLMFAVLILWGTALVPDSALYSTMVADAAPPERAGSLLTFQTALGFLLTAITVQAMPWFAALTGWQWALAAMALGPAVGIRAMQLLMRLR